MKKITFLAILLLSVSIMANAQSSKRTTAYNYLRKGKLDLAKENIDAATQHQKTMNDPKTWFYYGNIYIQLATTQDEAYKDTDPDALQKAYDGYKKCMELDVKKRYYVQVDQDMRVIANNYYARGLKYFDTEDYKDAYKEFNEAIKVNQSIDNLDTLAIYAAAMTAFSAEMYDESKEGYIQLVEMDYDNATIYGDLAKIYKALDDIPAANAILKTGIEKYPNEASLLFSKINILLDQDKYEEVIESLEAAIKLAPENYTLYFVKGQSYENMENFTEAESAYLKAIEMNPEYSDAIYNLGALHYNKAGEIFNEANDLPLDAEDEYNALASKGKAEMLEAQPYFEKALDLLPEDQDLKNSLMEIYKRTDQLDKLSELKNQ